ncbi:MAG TPA: helix-turn-helix transcriptional regulator [Casimicrobiaceae bacterium]
MNASDDDVTDIDLQRALNGPPGPLMIGNRVVSDRLLYRLSRELGNARICAGLMHKQVAGMMGTTSSAISRLERAAGPRPSLATLERYADVVGCYLEIRLIPLFTLEWLAAMKRQRW